MTLELVFKIAAQYGLPTVFVVGFCYWFFMQHLPSLQEATERRFDELKQAHTQALEAQERAQEKAFDRQSSLFESALAQIVDQMTQGFSDVKHEIGYLRNRIDQSGK
jgi:hypothetical protein